MASIRVELGTATSAELVVAQAALAAELAGRFAPESGSECLELAEALIATLDLGEAALAGLVRRVDTRGEAGRWGFSSTAAWLRSRGMRSGRAKERATIARQLERLPQTTKRFTIGDLSFGYVASICDAVARLDDAEAVIAEEILLGLADRSQSVGKVAAAGARIKELLAQRDGKDGDPESKRGYDRSWIATSKALDGGKYIKGYLNAEDAAVWDGLIAPLAKPAGADDRRDVTERTAAALMSVLTQGTTGTRALVILELDTLTGGATPARLPDGTRIPAEQARRIALNAGISILILGSNNVPLYLGYRTRFATARQREVLQALYPHCAVQGCEIPGTLCEVDHVNGFALGDSPTDIDLLTLVCGWHNRWKHSHSDRVQISRDSQTGLHTYRIRPPGERSPRADRPRPASQDAAWLGTPPHIPTTEPLGNAAHTEPATTTCIDSQPRAREHRAGPAAPRHPNRGDRQPKGP